MGMPKHFFSLVLPPLLWTMTVVECRIDFDSAIAELSIAMPQNESSFADEERPRAVVAGRQGVEWPMDYRLTTSLQRLDADVPGYSRRA